MKISEVRKISKQYYKMTIRNNSYGSEYTVQLRTLEEVEEKIQYCDVICEEVIKVERIKEVKEIKRYEF